MERDTQQEQEREAVIQKIHHKEAEDLAQQKAQAAGFPYGDYRGSYTDPETLNLIPEKTARALGVAVVERTSNSLTLAAKNPDNPEIDALRSKLEDQENVPVSLTVVSDPSLQHLWSGYAKKSTEKHPAGETEIREDVIENLRKQQITFDGVKQLVEKHKTSSTTELLEIVFGAALSLQSSDIHFEHAGEHVRLRFRIDGVLHDVGTLTPHQYKQALSRLKLLSDMKLNITNVPQDGRFTVVVEDRNIEIRSAVAPSEYGEDTVMRLLDPANIHLDFSQLGLRDDLAKNVRDRIHAPNGLILTTGPTGSGKTTTLYAFMLELSTPDIKVITIEDPIEYRLEGVEQTEINPDDGITFFTGLTAALRRDPDVMLVGEIRDDDTANAAVQAALTGHVVFSTLHTNDAAGAIPRLIDLAVKPSLIPSALRMVVAQRLVRRLCQHCSESYAPDKETETLIRSILKTLPSSVPTPDLKTITLQRAQHKECSECGGLGYKGRIGVFEAFIVDDAMEELIVQEPSISAIQHYAVEHGMATLMHDGLLKTLDGITTIEEIERVLGSLTAAQ